MKTFAFDVYGTLIDTHAVVSLLSDFLGKDTAHSFSQRWRDKQLEYSFRYGLMRHYQDFSECTRQALAFTNAEWQTPLSEQQQQLLDSYRQLPCFDDALSTLEQLQQHTAVRCFAFSNGSKEAVQHLLEHAGLSSYLDGIISCKTIRSFKPNPDVYQHFLQQTESQASDSWLVSSNSFDILGAAACGWNTAWVKRSETAQLDPWGQSPTRQVSSLNELLD